MALRARSASPGAGERNHLVIFERRPDASRTDIGLDDMGNDEGEFEERFREWASFQFLRGGEQVIAQRLQGVQPLIVTIPRSSRTLDITPAWRAIESGKATYMNIRSVSANANDDGLLDLLCELGPAA